MWSAFVLHKCYPIMQLDPERAWKVLKWIDAFISVAQHHVFFFSFSPLWLAMWYCKFNKAVRERQRQRKQLKSFYSSGWMFIRYTLHRITICRWTPVGHRVRFRSMWEFRSREALRVAEVKRVSNHRECDIKNGSKANSVNVSTHVQLHPHDCVHLSDTMG